MNDVLIWNGQPSNTASLGLNLMITKKEKKYYQPQALDQTQVSSPCQPAGMCHCREVSTRMPQIHQAGSQNISTSSLVHGNGMRGPQICLAYAQHRTTTDGQDRLPHRLL